MKPSIALGLGAMCWVTLLSLVISAFKLPLLMSLRHVRSFHGIRPANDATGSCERQL